MATPLSAFGKYAGVMMAAMCVMLMFAFVIGDPLMQYAGNAGPGGPSGGSDTVVSWDGGSMSERQLEQAVVHRSILADFQQQVYSLGYLDAQEDGVEDLGLSVQPISLPRTREEGVEGSVVRTKIFAEKAREAGMVVNDEMIIDYLRALGRDRVSNDQMREILTRMGRGNRGGSATIGFVFDLLREAMLANNYLASYTYAVRTVLPEERWEDWKKVNERVVVEAAPIQVADFVDEVPEPTEAELETFFAEFRDRQPSTDILTGYGNLELPSPLPAFATPPRVNISYLKADFNAAVDQIESEITDEEIATYYEENKESFIAADRALFGDAGILEDSGEDAMPAGEQEPSADEEEATAEDSNEEMTEPEAPTEESTESPDSSDEKPEPSDDAKPETEEELEESTGNPLRNEEPAASSAEETAPSEGEPADDTPADSESEDVTEIEPVEEEEEEEESNQNDAEEAPNETADGAAPDGEDQTEATDDTPYQPLSEVKDEIRRRLAIEKTTNQLREKMQQIELKLDDQFFNYFDTLIKAEENSDSTEIPEPPKELTNLKPLAEAEQLELIEISEASQADLRGSEIGGSINATQQASQPLPVWYQVFMTKRDGSYELDQYQPFTTIDRITGDQYLVMVTERFEAETPELDEMREQVVREWKRMKASELALAKAEEIAKETSGTGKSLADYFAQQEDPLVTPEKVQETDPFSFLTIGQMNPQMRQVPLRLSQPEPLKAAGPELLESVFALDAGEVGAHLNHDRSIAYLLRISQKIGTDEELRRDFLTEGDRWMGGATLMQSRMQSKLGALLTNLLEESGLQEMRPLDELR